jgi:hypothetical protein
MLKICGLAVIAAVMGGCTTPARTWKGTVEWPPEEATPLVAPSMEAGAALAAAAAVREMIRTNPYPRLFEGCSSPEQGLNVAVFKDPKTGLYYVMLHQRFDRCGGSRGRVLDWYYEYAVTAQGEVLAEAPPPAGDGSWGVSPAASTPPSGLVPPPAPPPAEAETPAPGSAPASVPLPVAPEQPPAVPAPASPPSEPPAAGAPEPASTPSP